MVRITNNRSEADKLRLTRNKYRKENKKDKLREVEELIKEKESIERYRTAEQKKKRDKTIRDHKSRSELEREKRKSEKEIASKKLKEKQKERLSKNLQKVKTKQAKQNVREKEKEKRKLERERLNKKYKKTPTKTDTSDKYGELRKKVSPKISKYKKAGLVDEDFKLPTKSEYKKLNRLEKAEVTRHLKKIQSYNKSIDNLKEIKKQEKENEEKAKDIAMNTSLTKEEALKELNKNLNSMGQDMLKNLGFGKGAFDKVNEIRENKRLEKGDEEDYIMLVRAINSIFATFNTRYADNLIAIIEYVRSNGGKQKAIKFATVCINNFDEIFGRDAIEYDSLGLGASKGYILARNAMLKIATEVLSQKDEDNEKVYRKIEDKLDEGQNWTVEDYETK